MVEDTLKALGFSYEDAVDDGEGLILYSLVRAIKPYVAVETGTHRGISAMWIAKALRENGHGHLWTCDIRDYSQKENFKKAGLDDLITFTQEKGEVMKTDEPIDFLFLDSYHEYEVVEGEMNHFFDKLSPRAIVVWHDCGGDNSRVGVNRCIKDKGLKTVFIPTRNCMRIYCREN